jgi:hypothetical protein
MWDFVNVCEWKYLYIYVLIIFVSNVKFMICNWQTVWHNVVDVKWFLRAESLSPVFSGVCVTRSLVLCVCFVDHCLYFWSLCCLFFCLPLWYLQTLLVSWNPVYSEVYLIPGAPEELAVPGPLVAPVTNPVISHEWGKEREVFTTSGTYPWSFVTQIFHNGQPSHGGDWTIFEVMTSTVPRGTLDSVVLTSFSGGGSRSTQREPPTMDKQLISFITCGCKSSAPFL